MAGLRLFSFTQQLVELSMRVRGTRHEILSANIANADTPGYRPRDIDYESVLQSAAELDDYPAGRRESHVELMSRSPLDLQEAIYEPGTTGNRHGEDRLDGNSVALDRQISMLTENSLAYETSLTLLSRTMAGLRYVISEGKR